MKDVLAGKTVLVTGGTGSIGSEIVTHALEQKTSKVIVFSRDEIKHFLLKKRILDDRLETIVGDVRNLRSVEQVFNKFDVDIIYHAAAMKHIVMCENFPLEAVETNILGTQNVVDLAIKYEVPQMITISTDKAAYPVNVMGATKLIVERMTLNANKISENSKVFSCVRFGNVANSRGSVIPAFIDDLLNHRTIEVTDPKVTRFIIRCSDAIGLILKATEYAQGGETFILKMKAFQLGDLVEVVLDRIAPRLKIPREDIRVNITGLEMGEKLHEDLVNNTDSPRIHELDDMYIILPDNEAYIRYPAMRKVGLSRYTSSDTELISKEEIEEVVVEYLERLHVDR